MEIFALLSRFADQGSSSGLDLMQVLQRACDLSAIQYHCHKVPQINYNTVFFQEVVETVSESLECPRTNQVHSQGSHRAGTNLSTLICLLFVFL